MTARDRFGRWRGGIRIAGTLLTLASIAYVLREVVTADWSALAAHRGGPLVALTSAAAMLYGAGGFLLPLAWYRLLASTADVRGWRRRIVAAYATTQIYKYLPSNVMHLLGRHAVSRGLGLSDGRLAAAAVMEILGLMLAAGLIALAFGRTLLATLTTRSSLPATPWLPWALAVAACATAAVAAVLAFRRVGKAAPLVSRPAVLAQALLLYLAFFVVSGATLYLIARHGLRTDQPAALDLLAIASIAWAMGFVVPGAPAGIGIREATMILLLAPTAGQAQAVVLAGLYRVATLVGDTLVAGGGLLLERRVGRRR